MIKIDVLDGSPVYIERLRAVLGANGLTVTARLSADIGPSWRGDLLLIDPSLVADDALPMFIAGASRVAPVMVLATWHDDLAVAAYVEPDPLSPTRAAGAAPDRAASLTPRSRPASAGTRSTPMSSASAPSSIWGTRPS